MSLSVLGLVSGLGGLGPLGERIVASSDSSSSDPRVLGLVFFLSGFLFYGFMYLRYRNSDKRHRHEAETEAKMLEVKAWDQQVDINKGVSHSRMKGANNTEVRGVVSQGGGPPVPGIVGNVIRDLTD